MIKQYFVTRITLHGLVELMNDRKLNGALHVIPDQSYVSGFQIEFADGIDPKVLQEATEIGVRLEDIKIQAERERIKVRRKPEG